MNTKVQVRTLEENKVVLLVLYREMEIALAYCTAGGDIYETGLIKNTLFRQISATPQIDWKEVRLIYYYFTSKETEKRWIVLYRFTIMPFGVKVALIINSTVNYLIAFV